MKKDRKQVSETTSDLTYEELAQSLKRSNELLDITERLSQTGGWEYDLEAKTLCWTPETFRIHGMEPDGSYLGVQKIETSIDCYIPEHRPVIWEAFERCRISGVPYDLELQMITVKGRRIWVRTVAHPVYKNGKIVKVTGNLIDITEQKEKDEALKASEMKFRAIIEQAAEMLFLHNMQGRIVDVNRAAMTQTGYTREELTGLTLFDIDPDAAERLDPENIWKALSQNRDKTFEVRHRRKDGSVYPAEVTAGKISFGNQEYILGMARDISERKALEQVLVDSERQANALFTAIPDMIFRLDAHGVFLSYKAAREELYADPEQFIGRNVDSVLPSDVAELTKTKIRETIQTLKVQIYDYELAYPDNEIRQYECRMVPYSPEEVIAIIRDITEKKHFLELLESQNKAIQENEERFRRIFEDSSVGIALVKEDFHFMTANEEFCRMIGRKEEELKSLTFRQLTHPEDLRKDMENLRKLMKGESDVYATEKRYLRPDQQIVWAKVKVSVIRNAEGGFLYFLALIDDITKRKEAEHELFLSRQILQEINATKDKFFSIIAHDLRNPFNSILGFSELLQERIREQDYREIDKFAAVIHRSTQGMLDLLTNLLEWSRTQSGHIEFNPTYVELFALIGEVIQILKPAAEIKGVSLTLNPGRKELVFADSPMIGSVMRNLVSNAIKFSHPGGKVVISILDQEPEFIVNVSDNGIGMPPDLLAGLFRIDESSTRSGTAKEKGTGLGLLLCKEFIEKHGGRIWAESQESQGSKVSFSLQKIPFASNGKPHHPGH